MNSNNTVLRRDEEYILGLRRLYENYGYKNFKMSKFEKYDLYLENKSFLRNGNIITVTDPAGRLLALKPDITISIVKNINNSNLPEKFYYNENIYIADSSSGEIKETTQVGLEYIGDLDIRALGEILLLAAKSLSETADNYCIAISHMGLVSEIIDACGMKSSVNEKISQLIKDKNLHGLKALCAQYNISSENTARLCSLIKICGKLNEAIRLTDELIFDDISYNSLQELKNLSVILEKFQLADKFVLDFSVMNDYSYYNGLVFQGFIAEVPKAVLSGGQYDNLVRRFGSTASAAGFAVYIDLLSQFHYSKQEYDCDVLAVYDKDCDPAIVLNLQNEYVLKGMRCIALPFVPEHINFKTKITVSSDGSIINE